jgi:hypothetical protein
MKHGQAEETTERSKAFAKQVMESL